jgi:integration host factor subunit beta
MVHWRMMWRAVKADAACCTWCGSVHIRASQKEPDALMRLLSLRLYRCESCFVRFALTRAAGGAMIKVDIVKAVALAADLTQPDAEVAVDEFFASLKDSLARGHRLEVRGFGVFTARPVKKGLARNPRTGQVTPIPQGHRAIRFRPGKDLSNLPYAPVWAR